MPPLAWADRNGPSGRRQSNRFGKSTPVRVLLREQLTTGIGKVIDLVLGLIKLCNVVGDLLKVILDGLRAAKRGGADAQKQVADGVFAFLTIAAGSAVSGILVAIGAGFIIEWLKGLFTRVGCMVKQFFLKLFLKVMEIFKPIADKWKPKPEPGATCKRPVQSRGQDTCGKAAGGGGAANAPPMVGNCFDPATLVQRGDGNLSPMRDLRLLERVLTLTELEKVKFGVSS